MHRTTLNIAALSDIHCSRDSAGTLRPVFDNLPERTDVLLLCGDLTDYGLAEEARILVQELAPARKIPILAVLGNHDWEAGEVDQVQAILQEGGVRILDGQTFEIGNVGFTGVKGFGGGFNRRMMEPWGETAVKAFVQETINEVLKLERALAKMSNEHRVVLLHYSPVTDTVADEPPEIFPFLGSSRFEDTLNRYGVTVAFHGHAHRGPHEGRTRTGIPVFNVCHSLLHSTFPDAPPFKVFSIPLTSKPESP